METAKNISERFYHLSKSYYGHEWVENLERAIEKFAEAKAGQVDEIAMYTELKAQHFEKIKEAVSKWDDDKSVRRAVEELTELSSALLQNFRGKISTDEVLREMADVRIALAHLEIKKGNYQSHVEAKMQKCT